MAVITGGRVNRFLQKYLGIKGEIVAPEIGPELHPVIGVTDLPTELRLLDSIRSFYAYDTVTGDATHPGCVRLCNVPNSNVIATVERVVAVYTPAAMGTALIVGTSVQLAGPTGGFGMSRDSRQQGNSQLVFGKDSTVATVFQVEMGLPAFSTIIATTTLHLAVFGPHDEWVIPPGFRWGLRTSANAETLAWAVWWRERPLEPSEASG